MALFIHTKPIMFRSPAWEQLMETKKRSLYGARLKKLNGQEKNIQDRKKIFEKENPELPMDL
jgi:hypothetical protein